MNIEEQRAACARFAGWKRVEYNPEIDAKLGPPFLPCYQKENGWVVCDVLRYHPDTDVQQANELIKAVTTTGRTVLVYHRPEGVGDEVEILGLDLEDNIDSDDPKWPAALTAAVAELQESVEKK